MKKPERLIVFLLDDRQYALDLSVVEMVVRAVEITPLPKAPAVVYGLINVKGILAPALNIRKRFNLPEKDLNLKDQIIIARAKNRTVAMVVDAVQNVIESAELEVVKPETVIDDLEHVAGIVKLNGDMVFIHDLDNFLYPDEEEMLQEAI